MLNPHSKELHILYLWNQIIWNVDQFEEHIAHTQVNLMSDGECQFGIFLILVWNVRNQRPQVELRNEQTVLRGDCARLQYVIDLDETFMDKILIFGDETTQQVLKSGIGVKDA